jgi:hypothetical protein
MMYYGHMDENKLMDAGETAEALIAQMSSRGFHVTKTELARWHRAGLLPRPQRHSLGRGRGMFSIYPQGTADQLLALCTIHRSEKRLPYVAWCLWWEGYPISIASIRHFLEGAREQWQQGIEGLRQLHEHPEQLTKLLDHTAVIRFSHKTLAQARKRVGRKNFPTFMRVLADVGSGTFEGYAINPETEVDERWIVEKGLGLQRARTNRLADAEPWLTGDTGVVLQELSSRLRHHPLGEDLSTMSESELTEARDQVRCFLAAFESISKTFDLMFSRGAFGFSVLASAIREFEPQDQAIMLLFWRMLRSWGFGPNMDQLLEVARQWQQRWFPIFEGLEQLRSEVPVTAEILAPKQTGFALRWKLTMQAVLEVLSQLAEHPDVKAFFTRHPKLTEVMEAGDGASKLQE